METSNKNDRIDKHLLSSTAIASDNSFAGFVDTYEGEDEAVNPRMIQGTQIKFANEATWTDKQGVVLDSKKHLLAIGVERVVNKWPPQQGAPLETIVLEPGQPFPDIKKLDEACPKSEWREAFGKSQGPYQIQRLLYLLDPVTLDKFTFATSTVGGTRALHELADKIAWMQRYRQLGTRPLVHLSNTFMPTPYGGRQRPHFVILNWVTPSGDNVELMQRATPQIPDGAAAKPDVPSATASTKPAKPAEEMLAKAGLKTVSEPTLAEEMNDKIQF